MLAVSVGQLPNCNQVQWHALPTAQNWIELRLLWPQLQLLSQGMIPDHFGEPRPVDRLCSLCAC